MTSSYQLAKLVFMFNHALHFDANFENNFTLKSGHSFRMATIHPNDKKQISEGLSRLSTESIRNRFLGTKKEFSEKELAYLTELDGWNHYALGVEEANGEKHGVAVVRLVRALDAPDEAEVAITIADEYQKIGLGSFLLRLMILAAKERKVDRLSFTYLRQNVGIVKLIHHLGVPFPGDSNQDFHQLFLDLKGQNIEMIKSQLRPHLPEIDAFHLKT